MHQLPFPSQLLGRIKEAVSPSLPSQQTSKKREDVSIFQLLHVNIYIYIYTLSTRPGEKYMILEPQAEISFILAETNPRCYICDTKSKSELLSHSFAILLLHQFSLTRLSSPLLLQGPSTDPRLKSHPTTRSYSYT